MDRSVILISALDIWSMGEKRGAQSLWLTIKGYAERGWKVFYLTSNNVKNLGEVYHDNIKVIGFKDTLLRKFAGLKKVGFFIRPIWWLYFQMRIFFIGYKIARKHRVDLFYGYEVIAVPVAKLLSIKFKTSLVSRYQGTVLKPKMKSKFWKIRYWHHLLGLKINSSLVIMTNDGTEGDKVLSMLDKDMQKVKFWVNGVNKDIYQPNFNSSFLKKKLGINKEEKILLTVNRLVHWKKVDRIINAIPEVAEKYPDIKLLIAGDGSERRKLERLVDSFSLNEKVIFLGSRPHEEVFDYFNSADIFISLNDLSNVGNPLLEAMVCGRCIVTLNNGDTSKFIKNEENGILLDSEDLNKLPQIICDLLVNDKKRMLLGQKAREFAESRLWTWEERIKLEIDTLEKMLE